MASFWTNEKKIGVADRCLGLGFGVLIATSYLNEGNNNYKLNVMLVVGGVFVVFGLTADLVFRRKQIAANREDNLKNLK